MGTPGILKLRISCACGGAGPVEAVKIRESIEIRELLGEREDGESLG